MVQATACHQLSRKKVKVGKKDISLYEELILEKHQQRLFKKTSEAWDFSQSEPGMGKVFANWCKIHLIDWCIIYVLCMLDQIITLTFSWFFSNSIAMQIYLQKLSQWQWLQQTKELQTLVRKFSENETLKENLVKIRSRQDIQWGQWVVGCWLWKYYRELKQS